MACAKMGWTYDENSHSHRLAEVLVGSLSGLQLASLELIKPKDPRAIHLIKLLEHDPGSRRSLHDLAREAGASGRTIERLFAQETNLPSEPETETSNAVCTGTSGLWPECHECRAGVRL